LEGDGGAGCAFGRRVFSWRAFDADLLPAELPGAASATPKRGIFQNAARSRAARISRCVCAASRMRFRRLRRWYKRPRQLLAQSNEESLRLGAVARQLGASTSRLRRSFAQVTGLFAARARRSVAVENRFKKLLRQGSKITDALYETGYGSSSRVYERSNAQLGMTPATISKGRQGNETRIHDCRCQAGESSGSGHGPRRVGGLILEILKRNCWENSGTSTRKRRSRRREADSRSG